MMQMSSAYYRQQIRQSWKAVLENEFEKTYFKELEEFVDEERETKIIYPPAHQVYEWTKHCDIWVVKVVILGQDPYHGPGQAHGLSFSVQNGVQPPSLVNIFKELENDINGFQKPNHGDLTNWAKQGVLLLNTVLTVEEGNPGSHRGRGWENLTDAVISWISTNLTGVVFMLWGADAQKKTSLICTESYSKHLVLTCPHPSPLSAYRGFFGCKHFSEANEYLEKRKINWNDL